jgi:hypothetical protein
MTVPCGLLSVQRVNSGDFFFFSALPCHLYARNFLCLIILSYIDMTSIIVTVIASVDNVLGICML